VIGGAAPIITLRRDRNTRADVNVRSTIKETVRLNAGFVVDAARQTFGASIRDLYFG
jgi:hypothetical protein